MHHKPSSSVSNINFDIWILLCGGGLYKYLMKNISRTAKFLPIFGFRLTVLPGSFYWLKCLGGIMHLKPTAGYQISILIFENKLWRGVSMNIPWKIYQGRQSSWPLGVLFKGIARAFNWLKCLGGFLHLKPKVGCQISTLIFDFFYG